METQNNLGVVAVRSKKEKSRSTEVQEEERDGGDTPFISMVGSVKHHCALPGCQPEAKLGQHIEATLEGLPSLQDHQCGQRPLHILRVQMTPCAVVEV